MGAFAVRIAQGRKLFPGRPDPVLDGIDLEIGQGEVLAILGSSGSGKSSLLRVLAGIDRLDGGSIEWAQPGGVSKPGIGVVFQDSLLMPWLTVRENIAFGGRFAANRGSSDPAHAEGLLNRFGLGDLADAYPRQLSGGQAQRVAVIRAVAIRPPLLLLDEPFSALDPATRIDLQRWLATFTAELGITTVLVTHDIDEAILLSHRIALLGGGAVQREWATRSATEGLALRAEILSQYRPEELVHIS